MSTIKALCEMLGWTVTDLSRNAGISWQAASNAWNRARITQRTKKDIVAALREAGRDIQINQIDW